MKNYRQKLLLLLYPFLIISVGFLLSYTFLNWLLVIKTGWVHVREDVTMLWLPLTLSCIPFYIWLYPKLKPLVYKKSNGNFGLIMMCTLATGGSTIIAQHYLDSATGKLTQLSTINDISKQPLTKYYTIKNYVVDKANAGSHSTATVSGKHNTELNYDIYIAMPVLINTPDSNTKECSYWLTKTYHKQIRNSLSDAEKDQAYKNFADDSQADFDTADVNRFVYLEKKGYTSNLGNYEKAIKKSNLVHYNDPVFFKAVSEPFEKRNGNKLAWIFGAFAIGAVVVSLFLLIPRLPDESLITEEPVAPKKETSGFKDLLALVMPRPGYTAAPLILDLNLLLFILMVIAGLGFIEFSSQSLLQWGGNYRPYLLRGQWWRLVTSTFLHAGFIHLFANMMALLFVSVFLEPVLGSKRYTVIYLATGIVASATSAWWHPATVSIGASGAIFGLYGVFVALMLMKIFPKEISKPLLMSAVIFIGYNLVMGLAGGTDNAAHVGGLVSGFFIGLLIAPTLKQQVAEVAEYPTNTF